MQKWEYLVVIADIALTQGVYRIRKINDQQLDDWKKRGPELYTAIVQWGDEGWQMISCVFYQGHPTTMIFMRSKP
jgi:hypothetical protein